MFDSRKYRPVDESLVDGFLRGQRHGTLMACAPGQAPQASILPYLLTDDGGVELHCVQADALFEAMSVAPQVSLLVDDFLADTPHDWVDPVDGSESTLHFRAVLLQGAATLSTDPDDVAAALHRLVLAYGHGPDYRPVVNDELYGPNLRRLAVVRIAVEHRQAKFKVGRGAEDERLELADRLRARGASGDDRAADVIAELAPSRGGTVARGD